MYMYVCSGPLVSKDLHSPYTPNDFLDVLVGLSSPNVARNGDGSNVTTSGLMKIQLTHESLFELVEFR